MDNGGVVGSQDRVQVRLPALYVDDWLDRCAEHDGVEVEVISRTQREVVVDLNRAALGDIVGDLRYVYAADDVDADLWRDYRGLVLSARATRKRLQDRGFME